MKKFLATFLALVMVLSSLCLPAVADGTVDKTDKTDGKLYQEDFIPDENGDVPAKAEIAAVLTASGQDAVISLEEDVTVTVLATATNTNAATQFPLLGTQFYGTFKGNNHKITFAGDEVSLKLNSGDSAKGVLFNTLGHSTNKIAATIEDLTVTGVVASVNDGTVKTGQFGVVSGNTAYIPYLTNVHVDATLTKKTTDATNVGGFIGKPGNKTVFTNCSFDGSITYDETNKTAMTAGGFLGASALAVILTNCTVNKDNQTDGLINAYSRAGGFIGLLNSSGVARNVTISGSEVYGTVKTATSYAGGFIGSVESSSKTLTDIATTENGTTTYTNNKVFVEDSIALAISDSTNHAAVYSDKTGVYVGGIVGSVMGRKGTLTDDKGTEDTTDDVKYTYYVITTPCVTMTNVDNEGNIGLTDKGNLASGLIGLIQYVQKSSDTTNYPHTVKIGDSTNSGKIIGGEGYSGGIIGYVNNTKGANLLVEISDSINSGDINAKVAGGMLGMSEASNATVSFTKCVNTGAITSTTMGAGGIMGQHGTGTKSTFTIQGCVNTGTVVSSDYRAGGIVAHMGNKGGIVTITDCINFGHVESTYGITDTANPDTNRTAPTVTTVNAATLYCMISVSASGAIPAGTLTVKNCVNFGTRTGWTSDYKLTTDPGLIPQGSLEGNIDFTATGAGATAVLDSALLAMGEGGKAQIRLSNDKADAGIRFAIDTNSTLLTALTTAGYTYTLGSLIATDANIGEGALTKDALGNKKYSAKTEGVQVNDDRYMVAVNGIEDTYYAEDVRCAGFIELTNKDGTTYTIYTEASLAKSLADVAKAAIDDTDTEAQAKYAPYKTTLEVFAAKLNSAE